MALRGGILLLCSLVVQAQHIRPEGDTYGYGGYGPVGHGYGAYGYPAWNAWAGYGGYPGYGAYYGRYPGYGAYYGRYPGYGGYGSYSGHGGYTSHLSSTDGARYKRGADQKYEMRPMGSGVVNPFGQNSVGLSLSPWYAYSASAYQDYKHHAVKHSKNKYAPDRVYGSEGRERICLDLYVNREKQPSFVDTVRKYIRLEDSSQLDNVLHNPGHAFDQLGVNFTRGGGVAACGSEPVVCWNKLEFIFPGMVDTMRPDDEGCLPFNSGPLINFLCTWQSILEREFKLLKQGEDLILITDLKLAAEKSGLQRQLYDFLRQILLPNIVDRTSVPGSQTNKLSIIVALTFGGGERECIVYLLLENIDFDGAQFILTDRDKVFGLPVWGGSGFKNPIRFRFEIPCFLDNFRLRCRTNTPVRADAEIGSSVANSKPAITDSEEVPPAIADSEEFPSCQIGPEGFCLPLYIRSSSSVDVDVGELEC